MFHIEPGLTPGGDLAMRRLIHGRISAEWEVLGVHSAGKLRKEEQPGSAHPSVKLRIRT